MDKRILIIYAAAVGAVALAAMLITIAVTAGSRTGKPIREDAAQAVTAEKYTPGLSDIPVPEDLVVQKQAEWYPLRESVEVWTEDMAGAYWIPVEDIVLDNIEKENRKKIDQLLDAVP